MVFDKVVNIVTGVMSIAGLAFMSSMRRINSSRSFMDAFHLSEEVFAFFGDAVCACSITSGFKNFAGCSYPGTPKRKFFLSGEDFKHLNSSRSLLILWLPCIIEFDGSLSDKHQVWF